MTTTILTVSCTACETTFPVDPAKVPEGGVRARCSICGGIFLVEDPRAVVDAPPRVPPVSTADRLGDAAFPEAGPDPAVAPEPWSGLDEEDGEEQATVEVEEASFEVDQEVEDPALDVTVDEKETKEEGTAFQLDDLPPGEPDEAERPTGTASGLDDFTFAEPVVRPPEPAPPPPEVKASPPVVEPSPPVVEPSPPVVEPSPPEAEPSPPVTEPTPEAATPTEPTSAEAAEAPQAETTPTLPSGFQFGRRDPHEKARRLARVLVSDIITYNPERYLAALEKDSLAADFEEEIQKSWKEYVEQVGKDLATSTDYWTDALNDLLARGRDVF